MYRGALKRIDEMFEQLDKWRGMHNRLETVFLSFVHPATAPRHLQRITLQECSPRPSERPPFRGIFRASLRRARPVRDEPPPPDTALSHQPRNEQPAVAKCWEGQALFSFTAGVTARMSRLGIQCPRHCQGGCWDPGVDLRTTWRTGYVPRYVPLRTAAALYTAVYNFIYRGVIYWIGGAKIYRRYITHFFPKCGAAFRGLPASQ